jgi:endonuclease YncB( thermonuclease family)
MKVYRFITLLLVIGLGITGFIYGEDLLKTGVNPAPNSTNSTVQANATPDDNTSDESESSGEQKTENSKSDSSENPDKQDQSDEDKPYDSRRARMVHIFDGDTFKVRYLDSEETDVIRLQGIDCPESSRNDKCYSDEDLIEIPCDEQVPLGKRATGFAKGILQDELVQVESYKDFKEGYYGRTIAYIRGPSGEDYGLEMVKKGYCKDSGIRYDHPREETYAEYRGPIKR